MLVGHLYEVEGLAFSPDGRLASSGYDKTIRLWDPSSGQTLLILKGHAGRIRNVRFSPDGRTLASASSDRTIKLWDAAPASVLAAARDEIATGSITEAADARLRRTREARSSLYAASSNLAMGASEANDLLRLRFLADLMKPRQDEPDLRGWEWHYLNRLAQEDRVTLRGQDREAKQLAFSPDGRTLASVHAGGRVRLWDLASGVIRLTLNPPQPATWDLSQAGVSSVAFSPDGERLAGPGPGAHLGIWNTRTGELLRHYMVSAGWTSTLMFSPDGRTIVTGSVSRRVRIWDATGRLPDANGYGPRLRLFDNAHEGTVDRVEFSPDGRRVASTGGGTIKVWDVDADKLHATLPSPNVQVLSLAFSPDGRTLASGGSDKLVHIWDAGTGRPRSQLSGHTTNVTALAFRAGGRQLLSGGSDGVVKLWDMETGRELRSFKEQAVPVTWDSFRPDGESLASSSFDRMRKMWDASHPLASLVLKTSSFSKNAVAGSSVASSLGRPADRRGLRRWGCPGLG